MALISSLLGLFVYILTLVTFVGLILTLTRLVFLFEITSGNFFWVLIILGSITIIAYTVPLLFNRYKIPLISNSILHFMFYSVSYAIVFLNYAFCKMDDLSWGTKGLTDEKTNVDLR